MSATDELAADNSQGEPKRLWFKPSPNGHWREGYGWLMLGEATVCFLGPRSAEFMDDLKAALADTPEPEHAFDDASVLNPVTGEPYGPGPLWAGTEPMDYPDPLCTCGALWDESDGGCTLRMTQLEREVQRLETIAEAARGLVGEIKEHLVDWTVDQDDLSLYDAAVRLNRALGGVGSAE
jgi:hypothetical protein